MRTLARDKSGVRANEDVVVEIGYNTGRETIDLVQLGIFKVTGQRVTPSDSRNRGNSEDWVAEQVRQGNPWYVGSQFEWAERPSSRPIYRKRYEFFRDCIGRVQEQIGRPLRALDVGCGDGYWLWRLAQLPDVEWTGLDYNPVRVQRARQVAPHADIRRADVTELDPGNPFDVILFSQVIERPLACAGRRLPPTTCISTPSRLSAEESSKRVLSSTA